MAGGMANPSRVENHLDIEVYTQTSVNTGRVFCPSISRMLDLLNDHFLHDAASHKNFLEIMESSVAAGPNKPKLHFNKSAIALIALSEANTGRGMGAAASQKAYPFVRKMPCGVTIDLASYTVAGSIHCAGDQSVTAILNERKAFLPMTDVIITDGSGLRRERPFVALNKGHIISLRENQ